MSTTIYVFADKLEKQQYFIDEKCALSGVIEYLV